MDITEALAKVTEAAVGLGLEDFGVRLEASVYHRKEAVMEWQVYMHTPGGGSENVHLYTAKDFDLALAKVVEKVQKHGARCPVCGGRTDGPCKHSHGEVTQ